MGRRLIRTTRKSFPRDVVIDELDHACTAEARAMAAVDDVDGNFPQTTHRFQILFKTTNVFTVNQLAVVNGVTRKKRARGLFPNSNLTGRMPRQLYHGKYAISQIDHVTVLQLACQRGGSDGILERFVAGMG